MADIKLFNISGEVKEYQSGTVTLEKELQESLVRKSIWLHTTFAASICSCTILTMISLTSPTRIHCFLLSIGMTNRLRLSFQSSLLHQMGGRWQLCGHRRNRPVYAARADKGDLWGSARQVKRETQTGNPHPVRWHRFYPFGRACTKGNGVTEAPPSLENTWFSAFFQTTVLRSPA